MRLIIHRGLTSTTPKTKYSKVMKKLIPTNTHQYILVTIITTTKIQDEKKIGTYERIQT
jgi:hypothetical protein